MYMLDSNFKFTSYTNIDFTGNNDDMKRTSSYVFNFQSSVVTWASKMQ